MLAIRVQDGIDFVVQIAETLHKVRHGCIAVGGVALRYRDFGVVADARVAAEFSYEFHQRIAGTDGAAAQDIGNHQRAGVDERIARLALFALQLHQRIERVTGRFTAHSLPDRIALQVERQRQRE